MGPQVVARALATGTLVRGACWLVVGAAEPFLREARTAGLPVNMLPRRADLAGLPAGAWLVDTGGRRKFNPGTPSAAGDRAAAAALDTVAHWAAQGTISAICTGPVRKRVFDHVRGAPFPGHTEFFHHHLRAGPVPVMLFVAPGMRLALHTIHLPLRRVPAAVTRASLARTLRVLVDGLSADLGVAKPRVDVLGLNPHASEGGRLGHEDLSEVTPAITSAVSVGMNVQGPFPADGYFAGWGGRSAPGAVLAMYHDQGLAPFKLFERRRGCQVTLGLSVPRTACDHGTAYDVAAGSGADPRSMLAALRLALAVARRRARAPRSRV